MLSNKRVLIIDDEAPLAQHLAKEIAYLRPQWQADVLTDSLEAVERLASQVYDAVFCDIKMPAIDGLKLLALNRQLAQPCPYWVFVTAFDQHAIKAFELAAFDYLLKPISRERLHQSLERMDQLIPHQDFNKLNNSLLPSPVESIKWLKVSQGHQVKLVDINSVHYFQAEDKMVGVYTPDIAGWIRKTIKELATHLPKAEFMQIHRGLLVRIAQIEVVKKDDLGHWLLHLKSGVTLPISRQFQKHFKGD